MDRHSSPHIHNPAVLRAVVNCDRGYGAAGDFMHTALAESRSWIRGMIANRGKMAKVAGSAAATAALASVAKMGDFATGEILDKVKELKGKKKTSESLARSALRSVLAEAKAKQVVSFIKGVISGKTAGGKAMSPASLRQWLRSGDGKAWLKANKGAEAALRRGKIAGAVPGNAGGDLYDRLSGAAGTGRDYARRVFGSNSHAAGMIDKGFASKHRALYGGIGLGMGAGVLGTRHYYNADPEMQRAIGLARVDSRYERRGGSRSGSGILGSRNYYHRR